MTIPGEIFALSSEDAIQELATTIDRIVATVHHALAKSSTKIVESEPDIAFRLLTEEYALHARARILAISAKQFVIQDFPAKQADLLNLLRNIEVTIAEPIDFGQLAELIIGLLLFANSVASKRRRVIEYLFHNLEESLENLRSKDKPT